MKIKVEKIEDLDLMPFGEVVIVDRWGGLSTYLNRPNKGFTQWDFFAIRAFYTDNEESKQADDLT